ncbi:hypothetical protein GDO86_007566 [Hymenochirus boettgeri]|uniref:Uncharacterized protein n=1 Tax=Hymenochirus boettgeri TaxID=247094 RepID=A0A8T2IZL6_9PIPI|nr:hypothetical protein GDO86_007566 [Hymenochirus boettgeri]
MQRSKLGSNADKQWEAERRGAKRAEVRLSNGIHAIEEAQNYHVSNMIKEQKRIQKDLIRIKQASNKSSAKLGSNGPESSSRRIPAHPAVTGRKERNAALAVGSRSTGQNLATTLGGAVIASGSSMTLQMRINDFMDGVGSRKLKMGSPLEQTPEMELQDVNIIDVAKTLSISDKGSASNEGDKDLYSGIYLDKTEDAVTHVPSRGSAPSNPQTVRQRRGSLLKDKPIFDEEIYAPDGGLRTMHTMPDLTKSLEEAKKARYVRHRNKPAFEKELSVQEIFQKDQGGNTHVRMSKPITKYDGSK